MTKCSFVHSEVNQLGHVVNAAGMKVDTDTPRGNLDAPAPRNLYELRIFLGIAGYKIQFIINFAESSAVFHTATSVK